MWKIAIRKFIPNDRVSPSCSRSSSSRNLMAYRPEDGLSEREVRVMRQDPLSQHARMARQRVEEELLNSPEMFRIFQERLRLSRALTQAGISQLLPSVYADMAELMVLQKSLHVLPRYLSVQESNSNDGGSAKTKDEDTQVPLTTLYDVDANDKTSGTRGTSGAGGSSSTAKRVKMRRLSIETLKRLQTYRDEHHHHHHHRSETEHAAATSKAISWAASQMASLFASESLNSAPRTQRVSPAEQRHLSMPMFGSSSPSTTPKVAAVVPFVQPGDTKGASAGIYYFMRSHIKQHSSDDLDDYLPKRRSMGTSPTPIAPKSAPFKRGILTIESLDAVSILEDFPAPKLESKGFSRQQRRLGAASTAA